MSSTNDRNDSATCLLKQRGECNTLLNSDAHNPAHHLCRGQIHDKLKFSDLAAADAYRALTLLEAVVDPDSSEYQAEKRIEPSEPCVEKGFSHLRVDSNAEDDGNNSSTFEPVSYDEYEAMIGDVYALLVQSLVRCGCMRDAYEFCKQARNVFDEKNIMRNDDLERLLHLIKRSTGEEKQGKDVEGHDEAFDPARLDAHGSARRVVYPWNTHEPDRNSPDVVQFLNKRLQTVAPKCEVRSIALPALHKPAKSGAAGSVYQDEKASIQLGLFAKEDISPGEPLLHEGSMLTATNRLHDDICDACNCRLPQLSASEPPVACDECIDTIFCSRKCHDMAQELYHGAVCGQEELETLGRDIQDPEDKADYLYLLLLERAIAMAATQGVHPLDLPEVKYIWGDFHELEDSCPSSTGFGDSKLDADSTERPTPPPSATLPFSFQLNVLQPMRILQEMEIDPFASLHLYDTWIFNTLYAKFRGTASGRLSTWDGGPEVCAVHPLWCLANHSCDPNVRWEWGGEITFVARSPEERVGWGPEDEREQGKPDLGDAAIKKDEEILNHYCDLRLPVEERREWMMGAMGGACQCPRCVWEAAQESKDTGSN